MKSKSIVRFIYAVSICIIQMKVIPDSDTKK